MQSVSVLVFLIRGNVRLPLDEDREEPLIQQLVDEAGVKFSMNTFCIVLPGAIRRQPTPLCHPTER